MDGFYCMFSGPCVDGFLPFVFHWQIKSRNTHLTVNFSTSNSKVSSEILNVNLLTDDRISWATKGNTKYNVNKTHGYKNKKFRILQLVENAPEVQPTKDKPTEIHRESDR